MPIIADEVYRTRGSASGKLPVLIWAPEGGPDQQEWAGKPAPGSLIITSADGQGAGQHLWVAGADGVPQVVGPKDPLLSAEAVAAMVAWWKLDETSGARLDSHGNNHLTDVNTVGYAAGKQGSAADIVGANAEYMTAVNSDAVQFGARDWSIVGWYYPKTPVSSYPRILSKTLSSYEVDLAATSPPGLYIYSAAPATLVNLSWSSSPALNTWHFFAAWHDWAARTAYLQIDNGTPVSRTYAGTPNTSANALAFGANSVGTAVTQFNGYLDEIAKFNNYILTADERSALYADGAGVTYEQALGQ